MNNVNENVEEIREKQKDSKSSLALMHIEAQSRQIANAFSDHFLKCPVCDHHFIISR